MAAFLRYSLPSLFLLMGLAAGAAAQTDAKSSAAPVDESVAETPQASPVNTMNSIPAVAPVKTGVPQGAGKWVLRIDKKTCPSGSEEYVDEVNGGVKCWVNTN